MSARRVPRWALARRATALVFLALLVLGRAQTADWLSGSTTATTLLGVLPLVDPLALLEVSLASRSWMPSAVLGAGVLVAGALVLGPVFCGWVCPLGLVLDVSGSLRRRLERRLRGRGLHLPSRTLPRGLRGALLTAVAACSLAAGLPAFTTVSPIHALGRAAVFGADPWLLIVAAIALFELAYPRAWCRALCPLGALYSLLGRRALLRVQVDTSHACRATCGLCTLSCPMGIPVMERYTEPGEPSVDHPDCTRCGACLDSCPRGLLRMGFGGRPIAGPGQGHYALCASARAAVSMDVPSPRSPLNSPRDAGSHPNSRWLRRTD